MTHDRGSLIEAKNNNINIYEAHLGGYIMSGPSTAPSGLDIIHGDPATWSPELWLWAISSLNVRSVMDLGCAEGHCMAFFHGYGCRVRGVDGSKLAKAYSHLDACHDVHDFNEGPYTQPDGYDLLWCCEFVEHVEARFIPNYLETFRCAGRFIFLTHALPGQQGWHHVNCQAPEYWIDKLEDIGFSLNGLLTTCARRVAGHGHFADRGLVFTRRQPVLAPARGSL